MLTILSFLIMLSVIVVVHEYGHYKVAVLCGVRVLKFSVGFGRPLIAWQMHPLQRVRAGKDNPVQDTAFNELTHSTPLPVADPSKTVFLISAIPLGGYVQMLDEREGSVGQDQLRFAFNQKSLKARAAVVAAGPLANLLLAVLLYACVQWVGQLQPSAVLGHPLPGSFAEQADLRSGDRILGVKALGLDTQYQSTATFREFINSLNNAKAYFQSEQPSAQELGATNSPVLLPQMVEIAIKRGETFNADTQQDELADGLDKTSSLEDIMNMSPTQTLTIDLSRWRVSEHFQSAPQERVQALKELGLTGPRRAPVVSSVLEGGVAQKAGVLAGDEILKINGQSVADAQELVQIIHKSAAASQLQSQTGQSAVLNWQIKRKSASKETLVNLELKPRTVQEDGKSIGRVDAIIGGSQELVFKRLGFWDGLVFASRLTLDQAMTSLVSFKSMVLGQLSWHELSGPLTLAEYAGKTAQGGWASFVSFVAFVSVSVGVLNLLPIPVLDGGQLMYYLWELFTGSAPSEAWSSRLMRFGLGVVLLMMCAAMFNDVLRLIG